MASYSEESKRFVVPNWRDYQTTARNGELVGTSVQSEPYFSIDRYIADWRERKTFPIAGDLISAAIMNGQMSDPDVVEAARFVKAHADEVPRPMVRMAMRVLPPIENHQPQRPESVEDKLERVKSQSEVHYERLRQFKKNRDFCCFNPIVYCEMARSYATLQQHDKAEAMMDIALYLGPAHRYVSRAAARLFVHTGNLEKARYVVAHNPYLRKDPWLLATEIAVNNLMDRSSRHIKHGMEMVKSGNYSPFSVSELSSALGTIEMATGSRKSSLYYYRNALQRPNDNSLAQARWLTSRHRDIDLPFGDYSYLTSSYEADTISLLEQDNYPQALLAGIDWMEDMSFSHRPINFASEIAYLYLKDYGTGIEILRIGLQNDPGNAVLENNLAYALALHNETDEAEQMIAEARKHNLTEDNTICLLATEGLVEYRKGNPAEGRKLYEEAIRQAYDAGKQELNGKAILNFAREEVKANPASASDLLDKIEAVPIITKEMAQLKKDIDDELSKHQPPLTP